MDGHLWIINQLQNKKHRFENNIIHQKKMHEEEEQEGDGMNKKMNDDDDKNTSNLYHVLRNVDAHSDEEGIEEEEDNVDVEASEKKTKATKDAF